MKYIFVCLIVLIGCKAESEIKISTNHNPSNNTESNTAGQNPSNQSNDINHSSESGSGDSGTNYELLHYGTRFLCYANEVSHTQSTTDFILLSVLTDSSNMGHFYSDGSSLGTSSNMWANGSQSDTSKFEYLGKFFDYSDKISNYKITEFILINSVVSREDSSENLHGELVTNTLTFYGL